MKLIAPFLRYSILCAFEIAANAQSPLPPLPIGGLDPFAEIKQFLSLTNDQYAKLLAINAQYSRLTQNKQERAAQVNLEINEETAKPNLDAMALGVRYLELEVICRELRDAAAAIPASSLTVLTDDQKVKLKQLDDALKLGQTILEAQSLGLLPGGLPGGSGSFGSFLIGSPGILGVFSFQNSLIGCRTPSPVAIIGRRVLAPTSAPAR